MLSTNWFPWGLRGSRQSFGVGQRIFWTLVARWVVRFLHHVILVLSRRLRTVVELMVVVVPGVFTGHRQTRCTWVWLSVSKCGNLYVFGRVGSFLGPPGSALLKIWESSNWIGCISICGIRHWNLLKKFRLFITVMLGIVDYVLFVSIIFDCWVDKLRIEQFVPKLLPYELPPRLGPLIHWFDGPRRKDKNPVVVTISQSVWEIGN